MYQRQFPNPKEFEDYYNSIAEPDQLQKDTGYFDRVNAYKFSSLHRILNKRAGKNDIHPITGGVTRQKIG
jgi:hypothetical protein